MAGLNRFGAGLMYLHKLNAVILSAKHLGLALKQAPIEQLVIGRIVQRLHLQDTQRHKNPCGGLHGNSTPGEGEREKKGVGEVARWLQNAEKSILKRLNIMWLLFRGC